MIFMYFHCNLFSLVIHSIIFSFSNSYGKWQIVKRSWYEWSIHWSPKILYTAQYSVARVEKDTLKKYGRTNGLLVSWGGVLGIVLEGSSTFSMYRGVHKCFLQEIHKICKSYNHMSVDPGPVLVPKCAHIFHIVCVCCS